MISWVGKSCIDVRTSVLAFGHRCVVVAVRGVRPCQGSPLKALLVLSTFSLFSLSSLGDEKEARKHSNTKGKHATPSLFERTCTQSTPLFLLHRENSLDYKAFAENGCGAHWYQGLITVNMLRISTYFRVVSYN